jgi:hypothetical protein
VLACGEPVEALHRAVDILLKLSDHPKAAEVADEFVRRAPQDSTARYLRAVALQESGEVARGVENSGASACAPSVPGRSRELATLAFLLSDTANRRRPAATAIIMFIERRYRSWAGLA